MIPFLDGGQLDEGSKKDYGEPESPNDENHKDLVESISPIHLILKSYTVLNSKLTVCNIQQYPTLSPIATCGERDNFLEFGISNSSLGNNYILGYFKGKKQLLRTHEMIHPI